MIIDADFIKKYLLCASLVMIEHCDELIDMDSVVGDGDLGLTMSDGFKAGYKAVENNQEIDIGKLLYTAGKTMASAVPSTMGTLMASGFMNAGKIMRGRLKGNTKDLSDLFEAFYDGVAARGKAKVGDKTFLDGMYPAVQLLKSFADGDVPFEEIASSVCVAAKEGYLGTVGMISVHGRAAARGEASRQLVDPGAAVAWLMMCALVKMSEK